MGLVEVAGYYAALQKGFGELGIDATVVSLDSHPFGYSGGSPGRLRARLTVALVRASHRAYVRRARTPRRDRARKIWWTLSHKVLAAAALLWAGLSYDVFIFSYRTSLDGLRDLPLLKLLRRKIIYVFHGSDSRPPYIDGALMLGGGVSVEQCIEFASRQKREIGIIERYADQIVNHPLSAHFHARPFVSFLSLGIPRDFAAPGAETGEDGPTARRATRILHCPSHPEAKGTPEIRRAVASLRAKGHEIEFAEITGRPNAEVLAGIARCDFVVDQVYCDTPMAGFAAEAAFLGKPAVVGGYGAGAVRELLPAEAIPPTLYCSPGELEAAVERLILDADLRARLGEQARRYVEETWAPRRVAARFLRLISGDLPREWVCDPARVRYLHGFGLPEGEARRLVREVVERGGRGALQLSDKPELEELFVEFAGAAR
jgi:hypothetical protein